MLFLDYYRIPEIRRQCGNETRGTEIFLAIQLAPKNGKMTLYSPIGGRETSPNPTEKASIAINIPTYLVQTQRS